VPLLTQRGCPSSCNPLVRINSHAHAFFPPPHPLALSRIHTHTHRDTVLSMGGSKPPADVFRMFRGREPSTEALLRHAGLTKGAAAA
jgi:Zn-dependent oligopeptidase